MPQNDNTGTSSQAPQTGERPRINEHEDLDYSKRTYISSPSGTDPWNALGAPKSRNISGVLARADALGLSKNVQNKL
ncbi:hypothetical protein TWF718_009749 [Orbilia javanica]|uniref:Uncharacterized protein n=1 Tax=Orbilia javanica TaxID=47235 RepID=A0AAN8MZP6_9PEZI